MALKRTVIKKTRCDKSMANKRGMHCKEMTKKCNTCHCCLVLDMSESAGTWEHWYPKGIGYGKKKDV